jgi:hypothetical protein
MAPFGGFKQSGIGREFGTIGLEAYLEPRTLIRYINFRNTGNLASDFLYLFVILHYDYNQNRRKTKNSIFLLLCAQS